MRRKASRLWGRVAYELTQQTAEGKGTAWSRPVGATESQPGAQETHLVLASQISRCRLGELATQGPERTGIPRQLFGSGLILKS